jgi:hypothetical protein
MGPFAHYEALAATCESLPIMSTGRHAFKGTEAARLIFAAKAAGLKVKAVTLRDGKPYIEVDQNDAPVVATDKPNPWDKAPSPEQP